MGADRATTGTNAGLDGGSATAGAANPSNAASSAAGEQLCSQLIRSLLLTPVERGGGLNLSQSSAEVLI